MNGPNDNPMPRRYGERVVTLTHESDRLMGVEFCMYPVDEPPLIEVPAVDRQWYRDVWESRGWEVSYV
jgi:hypothetical protein